MKKILTAVLCLIPFASFALETPHESKFDLNIRRIGVDWTKTQIGHAEEYSNSPVAAFTASGQILLLVFLIPRWNMVLIGSVGIIHCIWIMEKQH